MILNPKDVYYFFFICIIFVLLRFPTPTECHQRLRGDYRVLGRFDNSWLKIGTVEGRWWHVSRLLCEPCVLCVGFDGLESFPRAFSEYIDFLESFRLRFRVGGSSSESGQ